MLRIAVAVLVVWSGEIAFSNEAPTGDGVSATVQVSEKNGWRMATTRNFRVCTRSSGQPIEELALQCESRRERLQKQWLNAPESDQADWSPRCDIVIHATQREYRAYLGPEAGGSVGCTSIQMSRGAVSSRRIDLRADASDWTIDALPHEITHVVLADKFGNTPLPLWADEGMGVLAESAAKQEIRRQAAVHVERRNGAVSPAALIYDASLPRLQHRDAFYGRSADLVTLLIEQKDAPTFVAFIDHAMKRGYDSALREHYDINGMSELHTLWRSKT